MAKKRSASSPRERRVAASDIFTKALSRNERRDLERLAAMPDSGIDYSDAPELKPAPGDIEIGRFYRPVKQQISLRVDADVLAWFRTRGGKYQTHINEVLRREMNAARGASTHLPRL